MSKYYKLVNNYEGEYEIAECTHPEYGFASSREGAIAKYEEELSDQLDYTLQRLVQDRQNLIDFRKWKEEQ